MTAGSQIQGRSRTTTRDTIGRILHTLVGLVTGVGAFVADFNATHIYNPRWPPHAKFHTGQTMSMALALALPTLLFSWRRSGDARTNVLAATLFAGTYWWTQAAANLFPGVAWTDPDLLHPGQSLTQFPPQGYLDIVLLSLVLLGGWLRWTGMREPAATQA